MSERAHKAKVAESFCRTGHRDANAPDRATASPLIFRKAGCSCGGGCPSCQSKSNGLKISQPSDAAEAEADQIAERVMRMSATNAPVPPARQVAANTLHRKCDSCAEEEELNIERKALPSNGSASSHGTAHVRDATSSGGHALDAETRDFFEPRLGYDLSAVRIHTGSLAADSADAVSAKAYTLGKDIVFASGEYTPHSESGRHLLAHELAHVTQQIDRHKLHRTLKVDKAASDSPSTAVATVDSLISALCPDFEINSSDFVVPKSGTPCAIPRFRAVAGGAHPLGCCCLCTMTRPFGATWKIIISATNAPTTSESSHTVRMTPTSGPTAPELRFWTSGPGQTTATQPPVVAFGHELCGHAALMKIRAHPTHTGDTDRSYSDIHDPTVSVENALATEMGVPGPRRGLAGGGSHRGESLRVFTVGPFPANDADPTPFATQIASAVAFLNGKPELLFDTVGFSGPADTTATIGATRAARVRSAVVSALTTVVADVETSPGVDETLARPQAPTDGGVGASAVVELRMAIRPAGLLRPIGVPPPATPVHVDEEIPGRVAALKSGSVNQCHQLLANTAWP